IRDDLVTGVQTCALPISPPLPRRRVAECHPAAAQRDGTQQLDAEEVAELVGRSQRQPIDESGPLPAPPLLPKPLPDVYPEEQGKIGRASCRARVESAADG